MGARIRHPGEPGRISPKVWIAAFVVAALLIAGAARLFRASERRSFAVLPVIGTVPEFSFTTQEGKTLSRADLLGKVWVADFIFTRCPGPCPVMSSRMAEISRELKKADDVRLVSVTIDPDHDTPGVLKGYAAALQADPARWIFLTGPRPGIEEFTTRGMLQALAADPSNPSNTVHSTRFLVIDRQGRLRAVHPLDEPELVQKLLMDIGNLLREHSGSPATP